jgi:predicted RNA-binding protein Jag
MYDPASEAHEFIGHDRAEALEKAIAFFGVGEGELAIAEIDPGRVSGLGTRAALVVYRRDAGPPSQRAPERRERGGERGSERGGEMRRGREREGRRERGGDDGGPRRGRPQRGERSERAERAGRPARLETPERAERAEREEEAPVASKGTATTPLGAIGSFVSGLIERMGIGAFEIAESGENEGLIVLQIHGAAALALASGDGRAVDAIQLLANQASLCASGDEARRVVIDVEGNADQRATFLTRIAERAAQRARETGRPVALEAMSPRDRRTVHVALRDAEGIATMSVGDGRYRQVVVVPDSSPEYEEAKRYEAQSQRENRD